MSNKEGHYTLNDKDFDALLDDLQSSVKSKQLTLIEALMSRQSFKRQGWDDFVTGIQVRYTYDYRREIITIDDEEPLTDEDLKANDWELGELKP